MVSSSEKAILYLEIYFINKAYSTRTNSKLTEIDTPNVSKRIFYAAKHQAEHTMEIHPQAVITKDNVDIMPDAVAGQLAG